MGRGKWFHLFTHQNQCIHFHNQRTRFDNPKYNLGDTQIPVVKEAKFLGIIFDQNLIFKSHIQYLKTACQKAYFLNSAYKLYTGDVRNAPRHRRSPWWWIGSNIFRNDPTGSSPYWLGSWQENPAAPIPSPGQIQTGLDAWCMVRYATFPRILGIPREQVLISEVVITFSEAV